ncbi:Fic family protein [Candidatus Gracilibacteria bacterium]|nr:Fic family protein [Candidatus Gracilibacteria bacterium]
MYIRKDATNSNQIEGTRATFIDAIEYEAQTQLINRNDDVDDIYHYIEAINYGIERLKKFPISLRFITELHEVLMKDARTSHYSDPGNFRKSQNWIGGTNLNNAEFVPPSPGDLIKALGDLEQFIHASDSYNLVVKAGLIHAQFETLHPFLDGNGRTGRLLITLFLLHSKLLERPTLYLSSYFKQHKQTYYDRLNDYHEGKIEKWLDFYLDGVITVAKEAIETVQQITALRYEDMLKIQTLNKTASESAITVLPYLFSLPIVKISTIQDWTGFSRQGSQNVINRLVDLGILEVKDIEQTYGKSYIYKRYIDIFNKN